MSEGNPFTVSGFYKFVGEKRLMAAKCSECGAVILPPKPMCTKCFSTNLKWIELDCAGKLLSYTVIYVAPEQFQSITPYSVGIIELQDGIRLPGMIRDVKPEDIKIGMNLKIGFETDASSQWHGWTRYFFKPV